MEKTINAELREQLAIKLKNLCQEQPNQAWFEDIVCHSELLTEEHLSDMLAYIAHAERCGHSGVVITFNLVHDLAGIHSCDRAFLPRTAGYAKREKEAVNV